MLETLARACYRRRRWVLLTWVVALVGLSVLSGKVGTDYRQDFKLKNTDSQAAYDLLSEKFPERAGDSAQIVIKADKGLTDPAVAANIATMVGKLRGVERVVAVVSPTEAGGQFQVSPTNPQIGFVQLQFSGGFDEFPTASHDAIVEAADAARVDGVQVELSGWIFSEEGPPESSEFIGVLAAMVILLVSFGSLLAMGLPIFTALFGIGIGFAIVGLLSQVMSVPGFAQQVAGMIGIGVGIDYALFIVTRYREYLAAGLDPENAVIAAMTTAGKAVVFAGITVVIAMAGMVVINLAFVQGLAVSTSAAVAVVLLASITLLPALLGFVGHNINKLSLPGAKKQRDPEHNIWARWSRQLQKHPVIAAVVAFGIMIAMCAPVAGIRLGSSDAGNGSTELTTRRAYDLLAEGFGPGSNGPLLVAVDLGGRPVTDLAPVLSQIGATENVAFVSPPQPNAAGDAAVVMVVPKTSPQDEGTLDLIHELRDDVFPAATANTPIKLHIGGVTASFDDVAEVLQDRLGLFIGAVLVLSFLLLLVVFRSILVPLKAVIMNLLSIGAAYGLLVAVFQWGWLSDIIDIGRPGPIESFLPMMLFAMLFGLSMDYEVFLLSRVKEEYDHTGNNAEAVVTGVATTARVITAAAAIMVCVFGSFMLGDDRVVKEFGLGLSAAVLIDATIVRLVLVPATMELLGNANWWFPSWLNWLPAVHIEGKRHEQPVIDTVAVEAPLVPAIAAEAPVLATVGAGLAPRPRRTQPLQATRVAGNGVADVAPRPRSAAAPGAARTPRPTGSGRPVGNGNGNGRPAGNENGNGNGSKPRTIRPVSADR